MMSSSNLPKRNNTLGVSGLLIDMLNLRPKNVMLPGKTYKKGGAFVRKRAASTPKKKPAKQTQDEKISDNEEEARPVETTPRGLKGAIEAAKRAATKKHERGPSIGVHDSASVQERIRAWQSEGGGVVTASDIVVEFEDSDVEEEESKRRSKPTSPIKDRWGVREESKASAQFNYKRAESPTKYTSDSSATTREAAAPRKRIFSDGHWKRNRIPESSLERDASNGRDKKQSFDDGIRITPSKGDDSRPDKRRADNDSYPDDGIRVYATPPTSRRNSGLYRESTSHATKNARSEAPTSPEPSEAISTHSQDATADNVEEDESEKPTVKRKDTRRSARGIFGAVFEESKKMFARTETVYVNQPENPRIDNWLGAIPDLPDDPFINDEKAVEELDLPKIEPRRRRKSKGADFASPDPNGIWDTVSAAGTMPDSAEDLWKRQRRKERSKASPDNGTQAKGESSENKETQTHEDGETTMPRSSRRTSARRKSTYAAEESPGDRNKRDTIGATAPQALFSRSKEEKNTKADQAVPIHRPISAEPQPKQAGITSRRPFPSVGGHRLSTIASMGTLPTTTEPSIMSEISADSDFTAKPKDINDEVAESYYKNHANGPRRKKTRLTRHSDLISVLSAPRTGGKSIKSARTVRTHRSPLESATIPGLMQEITDDEVKYMRELRTLVDGVIPVLLASVFSKTESSTIANLFSPLGKASPTSDTIYSMGVALEGLKRWHKRLEPSKAGPVSPTVFLTWAQGVHRTYKDYLKAWRMGFQDVVVNLAPASDVDSQDTVLDRGLPRNNEGDVTNADGERVDVAFLLKRPLVRLKYLAKTLKGINFVQPSTLAEKLASDYRALIEDARHRVLEEKARLEDEAAANVDPSRARVVSDLSPISDFVVNKVRRVRARDSFDLSLLHSGGQRLEGQVELFLREDPPGSGTDADLLVCQVDGNGKWLLFPPISSNNISARTGEMQGEIIVMIRGVHNDGQQWHELLSLTSDDEQVGFEWVQMLGLVPVPPQLIRQQSFLSRRATKKLQASRARAESIFTDSIASSASYASNNRTPSPQEMQIPLGENVSANAKPWNPKSSRSRNDETRSPSKHDSSIRTSRPDLQATCTSVVEEEEEHQLSSLVRDRATGTDQSRSPRSLNEAMKMAGSPNSNLKRHRATRKRPESMSFDSPVSSSPKDTSQNYTNQMDDLKSSPKQQIIPKPEEEQEQGQKHPIKPSFHRQSSATPSTELPLISKLRKNPPVLADNEVIQDKKTSPRPNKLTKAKPEPEEEEDIPPPPPPHRVSSPLMLSRAAALDFDPPIIKGKRLSSSPLKYQYQPSSVSDDGSDTSSVDSDGASDDNTGSSDDEDSFEMDDLPGPLPQAFPVVKPPSSQPSLPSKTLGPSSSASQAPYKTVPAQPSKALRVAATISYWSDANQWVQLHSEICSIIVTPGLVEIHQMSAAHSYSNQHTIDSLKAQPEMPSPAAQPLLVLHLTPMVLLQQGTALDVTLRSPPQGGTMKGTFNSVNFLFRSRSPEEAESLYGMFHHSRMNNPTYIALQQARAIAERPTFDPAFGRGKGRTSSSWFTFGRQKSYRASSVPTPRAKSDPSVGTRTTSFSAKVFGNGRFNIAKSSIMSRRTPDGSIYTSSDNSLESGTSTPLPAGVSGDATAPLGLSNTRIRLYSREGSKWLDLGSATLTIMRANNAAHPLSADVDLNSPPEVGYAHGVGSNGVITPTQKRSPDDKRIVVISAKKEVPLLDVTLGNSCFERTARTGIALSLWELFEGGTVAERGGVTNGRFRYFMMQFQNEAACAFSFSIVGRHRY